MKKFTILFAAIALVCFAVPAMAIDWNFYGNARMATYWDSRDFGKGMNPAGTDTKDSELDWSLQGNSRIGANVKAENIKGQIELGLKGTDGGDVDVGTRRVYGVWDFGAGKLKVGKDYTPVSQFISGQVHGSDAGLLTQGTQYGGRPGQIALSFGGFTVALISPKSGLITGMADSTTSIPGSLTTRAVSGTTTVFKAPSSTSTTYTFAGDVDEIIPKIELGWGMAFDTWNFGLMGGYQYYTIEDVPSRTLTGKNDVDVVSYVIGGDVGFNFGPGYVKGALSYARNGGNARWGGGTATWDGDDDTDNVDTLMAALVGGLKVSDMLSFEAGIGWRQDDPKDAPSTADEKTTTYEIYGQSVIALAPGVFIIPEVGYRNEGDSAADVDQGDSWYLGGKWQINF
jgi:hypothetical protein